jgi:hypothetical protein
MIERERENNMITRQSGQHKNPFFVLMFIIFLNGVICTALVGIYTFMMDKESFGKIIAVFATPSLPVPTALATETPTEEPRISQTPTVVRGRGLFVDSGQSLGKEDSYAVALGDVDGDGDLDLFVANSGPNKVWLNMGNGLYYDSEQSLGNSLSQSVALGYLDLDGDLDAFVANTESRADAPNEIWLNNGAGIFSDSGQRLGNSKSVAVALADVDADGDLDAFVANGYSQSSKLWLNDGTGIFNYTHYVLRITFYALRFTHYVY